MDTSYKIVKLNFGISSNLKNKICNPLITRQKSFRASKQLWMKHPINRYFIKEMCCLITKVVLPFNLMNLQNDSLQKEFTKFDI